jgi:hypothetical protein
VLAFGRPATAALSGQPVDLGLVPVGGSASRAARLTAAGPVTVTGVSAGAPFRADPAGLPHTLDAGAALDIPIRFAPTSAGAATATLTVTTDRGRILVDLHGVGTTPGLAAAPAALDFGSVPTTTSPSRTVIVSNTGTASETVTAVTAPAGPFAVAGLPAVGSVIPAQQSVAVTVSYAPAGMGPDSGSLTITSTRSTLVVPLTGAARTGRGRLSVLPASVDFGDTVVGSARTLSFDVANTGNIPVTIAKA